MCILCRVFRLVRLLVLPFVVYSMVGRPSVLTANPLQTNAFSSLFPFLEYTIESERFCFIRWLESHVLFCLGRKETKTRDRFFVLSLVLS